VIVNPKGEMKGKNPPLFACHFLFTVFGITPHLGSFFFVCYWLNSFEGQIVVDEAHTAYAGLI